MAAKLVEINGVKVIRGIINDGINNLKCTLESGKVAFGIMIALDCGEKKAYIINPGRTELPSDMIREFHISVESPDLKWLLENQKEESLRKLFPGESMEWGDRYIEYMYKEETWHKGKKEYSEAHERDAETIIEAIRAELEA